jgi:Type ISP C-terminal specificity domain
MPSYALMRLMACKFTAYGCTSKGGDSNTHETAEELPATALYLNEGAYFANVPEQVWTYQLGGYPVLKEMASLSPG